MTENTITSISIAIIVLIILLLLFAIIYKTVGKYKTNETDNYININYEPDKQKYENGYYPKMKPLSERCVKKSNKKYDKMYETKNVKIWKTREDIELDYNLNKFNGDYIDTISVINNMIQYNPLEKYKFNNSDKVVTYDVNVTKLEEKMIAQLMMQIAKMINKESKKLSLRRDENTDWNSPLQEPNVMTGWEKQLKNIGVEIALYKKMNDTRYVKLKHIFKIVKNETEHESQHIVTIGIQKNGSEHIMIIKIYLLTSKYCTSKNAFILENAEIVGFITEDDLKNRIKNEKIIGSSSLSLMAYDNLKKDDVNWNVDKIKLRHDINLGDEISAIIDKIDEPRIFTKEMILQNDSLWLPSNNSAIAFA